jgi:all-trans-8'-apo-beta-carotenal 15,15'-oxygenase
VPASSPPPLPPAGAAAAAYPAPLDAPCTQADWDSFLVGYSSQHEEHARFLDASAITGELPAELQGTLLRNGPGLFEIGDPPVAVPQPFDGDGMVAALAFPGGGAPPFFANRFVRTAAFLEEQRASRMIHRGAFSVGAPAGAGFFNPFDLTVKQVANTGVVRWAGRTLALYEADVPYELAGHDLRTVGRSDAGGALAGAAVVAAHYRVAVAADGARRLCAFSSQVAGADNAVTVYEVDEVGARVHETKATLPGAAFAFLHDFAVTERFYVFLENPVSMSFWDLATGYALGRKCLAECLKFDASRPARVHLVPRPGRPGAPPAGGGPAAGLRSFDLPAPVFSFHHANAFDAPDGRVILDTVALPQGMDFSVNLKTGASYFQDDVGRGALTRVTVAPGSGAVTSAPLLASGRSVEFPTVAPRAVGREHRHTYMVCARAGSPAAWGPPHGVVKATVPPAAAAGAGAGAAAAADELVWLPGPDRWAGEPIFVPRPRGAAEDDGWVLTLVVDAAARKSDLVVLDARDMREVASVRLPCLLPAGLHGSFAGEVLAPAGGPAAYAPRVHDIRRGADRYE